MRREAGASLWDAAEAARLVREFASGKTESEFNSDLVLRSAIERQLEILGEALKRDRTYTPTNTGIITTTATEIPTLIPILNQLVNEARDAAGL